MCLLRNRDLVQLAAEAPCTVTTARRWATPKVRSGMRASSLERVQLAAQRLGYHEAIAAGMQVQARSVQP